MELPKFENRKLIWLVPTIMALVAFNQIRLATTQNLTPWKGGGFGMFASNASISSRLLVLEGVDQSGNKVKLKYIPSLEKGDELDMDFRRNIRSYPTLAKLEKVALIMQSKEFVQRLNFEKHSVAMEIGWESNDPIYEPLSQGIADQTEEKKFKFTTVIASIYELKYKKEDHSVKYEELLKFRYDGD